MKYKALFIDIDGTLVVHGPNSLPSPRVTRAINAISDSVAVCLATGRILSGVRTIIDHLRMTGLSVISNGIQIYDPVKKEIVWEKKLGSSSIGPILACLERYSLTPRIFNGVDEYPYTQKKPTDVVYSLWADAVSPAIADDLLRELSTIPDVSAHKMSSWTDSGFAIEISHIDASKLHGIVEVSRRLSITTDEIIGIGDGYNDFPLLSACGLKIAMGNAVPELKKIADFVAPSVDDDGVAAVIEKFILHE